MAKVGKSASGQLEPFPAPVLADRYLTGNPTFAGASATGPSAPE
jgi:hypothetical protein